MLKSLITLLWIQIVCFIITAAGLFKQIDRWGDAAGKAVSLAIVLAALIISITWVMLTIYKKER